MACSANNMKKWSMFHLPWAFPEQEFYTATATTSNYFNGSKLRLLPSINTVCFPLTAITTTTGLTQHPKLVVTAALRLHRSLTTDLHFK